MQEKIYECICGKKFYIKNQFNGHKAHCELHLKTAGKWDAYIERQKKFNQIGRDAQLKVREDKKNQKSIDLQLDLTKWIDEQHRCEKCNQIMMHKYASGRFCSKKCANSHAKSEESKIKVSKSLNNYYDTHVYVRKNPKDSNSQKLISIKEEKYLLNPKVCSICNKILSYRNRLKKTCGDPQCVHMQRSLSQKGNLKHQHIGKHIEGRHIVYKVINDIDNRYYIGVRKTDIEFDGYLGSGIHIRNMVNKYGKEHFTRITLFEFNNSTDAFNKEIELLAYALNDPLCVNLAPGGKGGATFKGRHHSEATKKLISNKIYVNNGKVNRRINPDELDEFLNNGFIKGKKPRK